MSVHGARRETCHDHPRIRNPHALAPEAIKAMQALEASFATSGLEQSLRDLVKMRDGRIAAIYIVRNPDKLRHVASALELSAS